MTNPVMKVIKCSSVKYVAVFLREKPQIPRNMNERTDERTNGQTYERTNGRTNVLMHER